LTSSFVEKDEIYISDLKRIFFGNAPPEFLLEVLIRTIIIYITVLFVVKLLGKRMSGQITTIEMAIFIMLGAIIGSPIQIPERGILTGILILFCTLLFQRCVNILSYKHERIEQLITGKASLLVKDGILQLKEMKTANVSAQQIFSLLRAKEIHQLGEVKRVYLEACGMFSVYKNSEPPAGLSVSPPEDPEIFYDEAKDQKLIACPICGNTTNRSNSSCSVCGNKRWVNAIR
jgi:uncharacterized membrane protein YcaP (DUF421 family)